MSSVTKRDKLGGSRNNNEEEMNELRRGPWTLEEDSLLIHYIARHGEGRWNMLAKSAGLKRNGKSCRLRWLNYLKPDIKRGNLTPQEQLLILELHSRWGNRWSKIAQHLPGRTDNEIKNYWRTRVQKQARQLNIESGSKKFIDAVRCFWMPRLFQKVEQKHNNEEFNNNINEFIHSHPPSTTTTTDTNVVNLHHLVSSSSQISQPDHNDPQYPLVLPNSSAFISSQPANQYSSISPSIIPADFRTDPAQFTNFLQANSELIPSYNNHIPVQENWCVNYNNNNVNTTNNDNGYGMELGVMNNYLQELEPMSSSSGIMEAYHDHQYQNLEFDYYYQTAESDWVLGNNMGDSLWNMDSM